MGGVVPVESCSELALAMVGPGVVLWTCVFSGNVFLCFDLSGAFVSYSLVANCLQKIILKSCLKGYRGHHKQLQQASENDLGERRWKRILLKNRCHP